MTGAPLVTVSDRLQEIARQDGGRAAVLDAASGRELSYRELGDLSARGAAHLRSLGVGRGDVVAVAMRNRLAALLAYLALDRLGAVTSPVSFRLRARERTPILQDARPKVFIYQDEASEGLGELPRGTVALHGEEFVAACRDGKADAAGPSRRHADEPCTLLWTSGSTGRPKGVVGSLGARLNWIRRIQSVYGVKPADVFLSAMPLTHSAGFTYAMAHVYAGAAQILLPSFHAEEVWRLIGERKVSRAVFVPSMLRMLLVQESRPAIDSLRAVICTGAPMDEALHQRVLEAFPMLLYTYYGSTESPQMTILLPEEQATRYPSVGRPFPGVRLRIRAREGESPGRGDVLAMNPSGMKGYWPDHPGPFDPEGWLETGDIGEIDQDGYLHVFGRGAQMIISGGLNVFLPEVEEVLRAHPLVQDVAAVGIPDPTWDRVPAALVVPAGPVEAARDAHALVEHCRALLAGYKVPRRILFAAEIPRNAGGKPVYPEIETLLSSL